jgi:hypothetical protein
MQVIKYDEVKGKIIELRNQNVLLEPVMGCTT